MLSLDDEAADAESLDPRERKARWYRLRRRDVLISLVSMPLGAIVAAMLTSTSCIATSGPMAAIEAYLAQFGMHKLAELQVRYTNGPTLHGSQTVLINEDSSFLVEMPNVTWPAALAPRATLAFVDLGWAGLGARPMAPFFPFIHSLWTGCEGGSLAQCATTIKSYLRPGNYENRANMYTFLLLRQPEPLVLHDHAAAPVSTQLPPDFTEAQWLEANRQFVSFDFHRLLRENPGMEAVAWNFMLVKGRCTLAQPLLCPYDL